MAEASSTACMAVPGGNLTSFWTISSPVLKRLADTVGMTVITATATTMAERNGNGANGIADQDDLAIKS